MKLTKQKSITSSLIKAIIILKNDTNTLKKRKFTQQNLLKTFQLYSKRSSLVLLHSQLLYF